MKLELPCGCIPDEFLCPEAERLRQMAIDAYYDAATADLVCALDPTVEKIAYKERLWKEYDQALTTYREHK